MSAVPSRVISRVASGLKALARPLVGTITGVHTADRVAALTFDDGPHPVHTPRLLDVLERHGVRATFFMVGDRARRHPGIVERAAAAGHTIANHSWNHPSFVYVSGRARWRQIRSCQRALAPHGARLFRSPGGHQTPRSVLDARILGFTVIGWDIDPRDYTDRSADEIAGHVARELRPGSIVVLHDSIYHDPSIDRTPTLEAVDTILSSADRDYEFVTVPELLRRGRPRRVNWFWRPPSNPFERATPAPPDSKVRSS